MTVALPRTYLKRVIIRPRTVGVLRDPSIAGVRIQGVGYLVAVVVKVEIWEPCEWFAQEDVARAISHVGNVQKHAARHRALDPKAILIDSWCLYVRIEPVSFKHVS